MPGRWAGQGWRDPTVAARVGQPDLRKFHSVGGMKSGALVRRRAVNALLASHALLIRALCAASCQAPSAHEPWACQPGWGLGASLCHCDGAATTWTSARECLILRRVSRLFASNTGARRWGWYGR